MSDTDRETRINQILDGCRKLHGEGYLPLDDGESLDDYLNGLREELNSWGIIQLRAEAKSWRETYPGLR